MPTSNESIDYLNLPVKFLSQFVKRGLKTSHAILFTWLYTRCYTFTKAKRRKTIDGYLCTWFTTSFILDDCPLLDGHSRQALSRYLSFLEKLGLIYLRYERKKGSKFYDGVLVHIPQWVIDSIEYIKSVGNGSVTEFGNDSGQSSVTKSLQNRIEIQIRDKKAAAFSVNDGADRMVNAAHRQEYSQPANLKNPLSLKKPEDTNNKKPQLTLVNNPLPIDENFLIKQILTGGCVKYIPGTYVYKNSIEASEHNGGYCMHGGKKLLVLQVKDERGIVKNEYLPVEEDDEPVYSVSRPHLPANNEKSFFDNFDDDERPF
jgi:hypothetical protein